MDEVSRRHTLFAFRLHFEQRQGGAFCTSYKQAITFDQEFSRRE